MRWVSAVDSRQLGTQQPYGRSRRRQSVVSIGVTQNAATVTGTAASDTIYCSGANLGKTISGDGGNDTITGTAFVDKINGGAGNDTIAVASSATTS